VRQETRDLVMAVASGGGTLNELLHARHTFVDAALAVHYGFPHDGRVELDGAQYGGLLTQGAVLTANSSPADSGPIYRGVLVRERLLCEALLPPPENLDVAPPPEDPSLSTRERYEHHTAQPVCASCHDLINPLGFPFEHYDNVGRWRIDDGGQEIDASGDLDGADFYGVFELADVLGEDERFRTCFLRTWRQFATGADSCASDPGQTIGLTDPFLEVVNLEGFTVRTGFSDGGDTFAVGERPVLEDVPEITLPQSYDVAFEILGEWSAGFNGSVTITNLGPGDWEDWEARIDLEIGICESTWQSGNYGCSVDGFDSVFFPNPDGRQTVILEGESVEVNFSGTKDF